MLEYLVIFVAMTASSLRPISPPSRSFYENELDPSKEVSSLLDAIPDFVWEDAAASLLEKGVATVRLSTRPNQRLSPTATATKTTNSLEGIHARAFRSARGALDRTLSREIPTTKPTTSVTESSSEFGGGSSSSPSPSQLLPMIAPEADSAHVTGFHHAGGMSRYNVRREGIVFSDNQCSCDGSHHSNDDNGEGHSQGKQQRQLQENSSENERNLIMSDLSGMFWSLHGIADRVLLSIEKTLELSVDFSNLNSLNVLKSKRTGSQTIDCGKRTCGWFQRQLGPTETSSQWHMKRFVTGDGEDEDATKNSKDGNDIIATGPAIQRTEDGAQITLPMHTDPSLVSVIIHDGDGESHDDEPVDYGKDARDAPGALGLQYFHPKDKRWKEPEAHGHSVATIFVGSVLAHLTCGTYPAAKHRVVETAFASPKQRMAATLFVRPQPTSLLLVPLPSSWLEQRIEEEESERDDKQKKKKSLAKPPITFDAWLKRVARNYEKQKKKQMKKNEKKALYH